MKLTGHVNDATQPVSGAVVRVGTTASAVTDAQGYYELSFPAAIGSDFAIGAVHGAHAAQYRRVPVIAKTLEQDFTLKSFDASQEITVPAQGESAVVVKADHNDASVSVAVPYGVLQDKNGALVTGRVTVNIAVWNPNETMVNPPSPLRGLSGDRPMGRLLSAGMTDIVIEQNGEPLQIASGASLQLNFKVPDNIAALSTDANGTGAFGLWSADANSGYWELETMFDDKVLSYANSSNEYIAQIPHLSPWNIDGYWSDNMCLRGKVIDGCGKMLSSQQFTLWVMSAAGGAGAINQYLVTTAPDGSFCTNVWGSGSNTTDPKYNQLRFVDIYFFASAPYNPGNSVCNYTNTDDFGALCTSPKVYPLSPDNHWCTGAELDGGYVDTHIFRPYNFSEGLRKCNAQPKSVRLCGSCDGKPWSPTADGAFPGVSYCVSAVGYPLKAGEQLYGSQNCEDLGTLKVPYCNGGGTPTTPGKPAPPDPCAGKSYKEADRCDPKVTPDCCKKGVLECADGYCVPVNPN